MKNFKKTIKTTVLFLIVLTIFSSAVMEFFFSSESYFYQDYRERDELAGTLDYFILGSSHGLRAFRPDIMHGAGCQQLQPVRLPHDYVRQI